MIEANQLRIGNWIMDRGNKQWQIDCWELPNKVAAKAPYIGESLGKPIYGHPLTEDVEYLQPIPLTPEILEKCGFERINHISEGILYKNNWLRCNEFISGWAWRGGYISNKPKYLHQLQNLYYCICGEELIYKP